jgi:hypothetical protein
MLGQVQGLDKTWYPYGETQCYFLNPVIIFSWAFWRLFQSTKLGVKPLAGLLPLGADLLGYGAPLDHPPMKKAHPASHQNSGSIYNPQIE